MDVVMDLTARAVSYITLAQDISYSVKPQPNEGIPSQPAVLLQDPKDINDQLRQNYIPFQKRISEVVSIPSNAKFAEDDDPIYTNWFITMEALLLWMSQVRDTLTPELCYYPLPLDHSANKDPEENKRTNSSPKEALVRTDPYPAPQQWREAIRSALYKDPEQRIEVAKALNYLPVLVELACKGDIGSDGQSYNW
ncbi:hypothetical protein GCM10028818_37850 [Spirosoma horti]